VSPRLPLGEMSAHSTQCLRSNPEIGREHALGHLLGNRRIPLHEIQVPLLDGHAQRVDDPPVLFSCVFLKRYSEHRGESRHALDHAPMRRLIEQQELGVDDRIDEALTRRAAGEERAIAEPPIVGRELEDDFLPFGVDNVAAQTAFGYKGCVAHRLSRALQKFASVAGRWHEEFFQGVELLRREGRPAFEIHTQRIELGHTWPHPVGAA